MSDHGPRLRWRCYEFADLVGISLSTLYRMRKKHGWGKWIYASQVRRCEPDIWEHYARTVIGRLAS